VYGGGDHGVWMEEGSAWSAEGGGWAWRADG
jgi:hypothetical protein